MVWDGCEPRAVVPPRHLRHSRDVLCPRPCDMAASPFPLGLGVSVTSSGSGSRTKALPLYYVSERVAIERSPCSHPRNASGVLPGWYLVAQPNLDFEVVMTKVNGELPVKGLENQFSSCLYVDGVYTHQKASFYEGKPVGIQFRAKGFVKERLRDSDGNGRKHVNGFRFRECVKSADDEVDNSEVGTIRADFALESRLSRADCNEEMAYRYGAATVVSETDAVKYGKSLIVSHQGRESVVSSRASQFAPLSSRLMHEGDICIYVREKSWMKSRRLIDAAGKPCTYQTFVSLLADEEGQTGMSGAIQWDHGNRGARHLARNVRGWLRWSRHAQNGQHERGHGDGRGGRAGG